jgi:multidrug transporter EmrE-like cation transporter
VSGVLGVADHDGCSLTAAVIADVAGDVALEYNACQDGSWGCVRHVTLLLLSFCLLRDAVLRTGITAVNFTFVSCI